MKKILSIIAIGLSMVSCVDTVILPDDKVVDENMWQKKSDVTGIVACAYAQLKNEELQRNFIVWGDFRSDELQMANSVVLTNSVAYVQDLNQVYSLNILPSNSFTSWGALYSAINYCNLVIEKAGGVVSIDPNYTEGDYKTDIAKVKALRALCYFYLVRVFRDVPVTTEAYMTDNQKMELEQKAPAEVLQLCINDLKDAEGDAILSNTYGDWRDKGYMTRDAVWALLADIYLWRAAVNHQDNPSQAMADYNACVEYCNKVIESKKNAHVKGYGETEEDYYLAERDDYYNDVFASTENSQKGFGGKTFTGMNSEESIFEVQYRSVSSSGTGVLYNNPGVIKMYYKYNASNSGATPYLMTTSNYGVYSASASGSAVFKNTDDVRQNEFIYGANSANELFQVRKFIATSSCNGLVETGGPSVDNVRCNWILYRLTDVMLMKAEALVELYELNSAAAEAEETTDDTADDSSDDAETPAWSTYLEDAFELVHAVNTRALPEGSSSEIKFSTYRTRMESLVLLERARELCFEGKRWFDLMRYNYRHVSGVRYDLTFAQQGGNYVSNYSEMLALAMSAKYTSPTTMATKMPTEPYLYWPISTAQMDVNTKLVQNPVWKASSSSSARN